MDLGIVIIDLTGISLNTATEAILSNSKMAKRLKKLQIGYESAIYDLVKAICYVSSTFGTYNLNTEDMVIQFDDSIIEDKNSESDRALRELNAGVLSKVEYRMKIYGESKEIAKKAIEEIKASEPTVDDLIPNNAEE